MTRPDRRARLGRVGAERISAGCYGALIAATTLIGLQDAPLGNVVLVVVLTNLIYYATHVFAYTIGGGESPRDNGWAAMRHHAKVSAPMVSVTFLPVIAVILLELTGVGRGDALVAGVAIALLYLVGVATGGAYLRGIRPWGVAVVAVVTFVVSVILVLAKLSLH